MHPVGLIYSLVSNPKNFGQALYVRAFAEDKSANTYCADLFNRYLLTDSLTRYEFGNSDETISGVLGKNFLRKSLSPVGIWLYNLLEKIEPNHSINAIEVDETYEVKVEGKTIYKEEKHTEIDLNP